MRGGARGHGVEGRGGVRGGNGTELDWPKPVIMHRVRAWGVGPREVGSRGVQPVPRGARGVWWGSLAWGPSRGPSRRPLWWRVIKPRAMPVGGWLVSAIQRRACGRENLT